MEDIERIDWWEKEWKQTPLIKKLIILERLYILEWLKIHKQIIK